MSEFRSFACWDPVVVRRTVFSDVGALTTEEDAVFLATHVSFPIQQLTPSIADVNEHDVLRCLTDSIDDSQAKNLVIAVTGPSGSGKSHLVRWVRAHLDQQDARIEVVYIPRRVTSLREITHLLLQQLGGSLAAELETELDQAVLSVGPSALAETVLNRIWEHLKFRPPSGRVKFVNQLLPLRDESDPSLGRTGLASLMGLPRVREHLLRKGGTLDRLARSILEDRSGGDSEKPSFPETELNFGRLTGVRTGLSKAAQTAVGILDRETGRDAAATLLNTVRDYAIQEVLGMRQGRGLREVFADARHRLRGRQLVLMFEDLAQMDFVEAAVLDEFANHGDADHAPLRVIFAVTDDKYATLVETIEGRVTNRFSVGEAPLHDASSLDNRSRRNQFFAHYLNAARIGKERLLAAHQSGEGVPNRCAECEFQEECHTAFDFADTEMGPIGLYPYNESALAHGVNKQFAIRHQAQRVLTPRVLIDQLVDFGLIQAHEDLRTRSMPSEQFSGLLDDEPIMISPVELVPEFPEGSEDLLRTFRVRSYWFDLHHETEGVAHAFELPHGVRLDEGEGRTVGEEEESAVGREEGGDERRPPPPPPPPPVLGQILQWERGEVLDPRSSTTLRQLLRELTERRLDLDRYLLHSTSTVVKELLKAALGDGSFDIAGAPGVGSAKQLSFHIPRSNAGSRLLIAALWINDHNHWDFDDPGRKWSLPQTRAPHDLALELESFLTDCVNKVEAAVVATLFTEGGDPVLVAATLEATATRAVAAETADVVPSAWQTVVVEAKQTLASSITSQITTALAGARQSPTSAPAVIDAIRTVPSSTIDLLGGAGRFQDFFPGLAPRATALHRKIKDAIDPTVNELLTSVDVVVELLGDLTLAEVGEASALAARAALGERVFSGRARLIDFENAAQRLRDATLNVDWWRTFGVTSASTRPTLPILLDAIPTSGLLIRVRDDLRVISDSLTATREALDQRLAEEGGDRSLDEERRSLIVARDRVIDAARIAFASVGSR